MKYCFGELGEVEVDTAHSLDGKVPPEVHVSGYLGGQQPGAQWSGCSTQWSGAPPRGRRGSLHEKRSAAVPGKESRLLTF